MNETNDRLHASILEAVENQLRDNTPAEVRLTFKRLCDAGIDEQEAKNLIASALTIEIFGALKNQEPYDEARYIYNLKKLPELPFHDE